MGSGRRGMLEDGRGPSPPAIAMNRRFDDPVARAVLATAGPCVVIDRGDPASVARAIVVGSGARGCIVAGGQFRVTGEMIALAPRLEALATISSGADHVDLQACTRHGVPVINGAGVGARAVAEYVVGAVIAVRRGFVPLHAAAVAGGFDWSRRLAGPLPAEAAGATLGLVGYGQIGQAVAGLARGGLDMNVLAFTRRPRLDTAEVAFTDDLDDLLTRSEVVSLHVPLTDMTRGLIDRRRMRLVGAGGILVNTSRGGIIREADLLEALRAGELGAAVIDVWEHEPWSAGFAGRLREVPNILATPHVAGITAQAHVALERHAARELAGALAGIRPSALANPDVRFPARARLRSSSRCGTDGADCPAEPWHQPGATDSNIAIM